MQKKAIVNETQSHGDGVIETPHGLEGMQWRGKAKDMSTESVQGIHEPNAKCLAEKEHHDEVEALCRHIMALYTRGLSYRQISASIMESHRMLMGAEMIARIIENTGPRLRAWQTRRLAQEYIVVCIGETIVKVAQGYNLVSKKVYTLLGVGRKGGNDVLGMWLTGTANEEFWESVFGELQSRGVQRIFTVCGGEWEGLGVSTRLTFPMSHVRHSGIQATASRIDRNRSELNALGEMTPHPSDTNVRIAGSMSLMEELRYSLGKTADVKAPFLSDEIVFRALFWRVIEWISRMMPSTKNEETVIQ